MKDYWETDSKMKGDDEQNIAGVPTFIRILVIRRILINDMKRFFGNNAYSDDNNDHEEYIKNLIEEIKDLDDALRLKVYKTLYQLMNGADGIKNYLNCWDEKDNNPFVVEMVFNKIILNKFVNEYQEITTYKSKNDEKNQHYCQDFVFNTVDLMRTIFQFLDYRFHSKGDDLYNCSLTCSYWLYHVYNTCLVTIHLQELTKLMELTMNYDKKNNKNTPNIRMWQRLSKLKSMDFHLGTCSPAPNQLLLDKLAMVRNVENLDGCCVVKHLPIVKTIMGTCKENIKWCRMRILSSEEAVVSPLKLINARHIVLKDFYFYIIWSKKCETIKFDYGANISKQWCDFVINNCDCNNIKCLSFDNAKYVNDDFIGSNFKNSNGKKVLKQFAKQFVNLKDLIITFRYECDEVLLLFCKYLKKIIAQNDVRIEIQFDNVEKEWLGEFNKLIGCVEEISIGNKISKLDFDLVWNMNVITYIRPTFEAIKKLFILCSEGVEHIKFRNGNCSIWLVDSIEIFVNQVSFKSLKIFEYHHDAMFQDSSFQTVSHIMQIKFNKLSKSKLFIIATFEAMYEHDEKFGIFFDQFCQNTFNLMFKDKMVMDIKLNLYYPLQPGESKHNEYNNVYLSHFNEKRIYKLIKDYKQPEQREHYRAEFTKAKNFFYNILF